MNTVEWELQRGWRLLGRSFCDGSSAEATLKAGGSASVSPEPEPESAESDAEPMSVYVKNVNWETTKEALNTEFSKYGAIRSISLKENKVCLEQLDPKPHPPQPPQQAQLCCHCTW